MDLPSGQQGTAGPGSPALAEPLGHPAAILGPTRSQGFGCTPYYLGLSFLIRETGEIVTAASVGSAGVKAPGTCLARAPHSSGPAQPALALQGSEPPQPTREAPSLRRACVFQRVLATHPSQWGSRCSRRGRAPQGFPSEPVGRSTALEQAAGGRLLSALCLCFPACKMEPVRTCPLGLWGGFESICLEPLAMESGTGWGIHQQEAVGLPRSPRTDRPEGATLTVTSALALERGLSASALLTFGA